MDFCQQMCGVAYFKDVVTQNIDLGSSQIYQSCFHTPSSVISKPMIKEGGVWKQDWFICSGKSVLFASCFIPTCKWVTAYSLCLVCLLSYFTSSTQSIAWSIKGIQIKPVVHYFLKYTNFVKVVYVIIDLF